MAWTASASLNFAPSVPPGPTLPQTRSLLGQEPRDQGKAGWAGAAAPSLPCDWPPSGLRQGGVCAEGSESAVCWAGVEAQTASLSQEPCLPAAHFLRWSSGSGFGSAMSGHNLSGIPLPPVGCFLKMQPSEWPTSGLATASGGSPRRGPPLGCRLYLYTSRTQRPIYGLCSVLTGLLHIEVGQPQ